MKCFICHYDSLKKISWIDKMLKKTDRPIFIEGDAIRLVGHQEDAQSHWHHPSFATTGSGAGNTPSMQSTSSAIWHRKVFYCPKCGIPRIEL